MMHVVNCQVQIENCWGIQALLDNFYYIMHDSCMATKTITLELDAYERLKRAKRSSKESFSSVVRRAVWQDETCTSSELLQIMKRRMKLGKLLPNEPILDRLDRAQESPRTSKSKW